MVSHIWTAITSVNNAKIFLKILRLLGPTKLFLQPLFSGKTLVCARHNISVFTKVRN